MAIENAPQQLTISKIRRTWRVELFSDLDLNSNYEIRIWRETILVDADTNKLIKQTPDPQPLVRRLSQFKPGDRVFILASEIAALADEWEREEAEASKETETRAEEADTNQA